MAGQQEGTAKLKVRDKIDYGSDARAGSYARRKARERHRTFLRKNWRWLGGVNLAGCSLFIPGAILLPDGPGSFFLGVGITLMLCVTAGGVVLLSGTASALMGEVAEQWTAQELRNLREQGWHLANHVYLRGKRDIDHVLIGPSGAIVVETKWSGEPWFEGSYNRNRVEAAARTVAQSARDLHAHLGRPNFLVRPVVMLWGAGLGQLPEDQQVQQVGDTTVVTAAGVERWRKSVAEGTVPAADVERHWSSLVTHIERREAAIPEARIPSSVAEIAERAGLSVVGFVAGLFFGAFSWRLLEHLILWVVVLGCGITLGAVARRIRRVRLPATAFVVGVAFWLVLLIPLMAYAYLR